MDIDEQLRAQSKLLLQRLKARQAQLQNVVYKSCSPAADCEEDGHMALSSQEGEEKKSSADDSMEVKEEFDRSTVSMRTLNSRQKGLQKLSCSSNKKVPGQNKPVDSNKDIRCDKKEHGDKDFEKLNTPEKPSKNVGNSPSKKSATRSVRSVSPGGKKTVIPQKHSPARPVKKTYKRPQDLHREIIDKNVRVECNLLNDSEILDKDTSRLNFSYSKFDESDIEFMRAKLKDKECMDKADEPKEHEMFETERKKVDASNDDDDEDSYSIKLNAAGNDRKVANLIKDTMIKPKSILMTTGPKSLKKSLAKVSFLSSNNSTNDSSIFGKSGLDRPNGQHLLGYDWIAGLIDNDRGLGERSEDYFEELREFRRLNRDECVNNFYMSGVDALLEGRDREPSPVAEALQDTSEKKPNKGSPKVKPYTVNERLFTEPIRTSVLGPYHYDEGKDASSSKSKPPTAEEPRFVRVSIPRSTLLSPHRVKPHRRKSLEDTDTFALSKHCVMGYENSVPSMMPAASNVGLRDATHGVKSKIQTTLDEAETIAASYPYPWTSSNSNNLRKPRADYSDLEQSYRDMTLPTSLHNGHRNLEKSRELQSATEDLLNSTYSLMFELDCIKQQRDNLTNRATGVV